MSKQERIQTAIKAMCDVMNYGDIPDEEREGAYDVIGVLITQEDE